MKEIGFWDYTAPQHGSLECYTKQDWDLLLDDMAEGGFNSFVLCIKWMTTGYRSKFAWLDQNEQCTAISSDNELIHYALDGARMRGIKTWILVVATQFPVKQFGLNPLWTEEWTKEVFGEYIGYYDLDHPGLQERILDMFGEITELFGHKTDGIIVELEFCDRDEPHRIELYNHWASDNNRPDYASIKNIRLQPRSFPFTHWRDFTTHRRIKMLKEIEALVRAKGFTGEIATICEIEIGPSVVIGGSNLQMIQNEMPSCKLVTYDGIYDRRVNRLATMDFCIEQPKKLGHSVYYLSRGVMPSLDDPGPLEQQWRMTLEDARDHQPDGLWFMGSDCRVDGMVCSIHRLPKVGFDNGRDARLKLMGMAGDFGFTHPLTS